MGYLDQLRTRPRIDNLSGLFARCDVVVVPDEDNPGHAGKMRDDRRFVVIPQVVEEAQVGIQRCFVDHIGMQVDDPAVRGAGEYRDRERRSDQTSDFVAQPSHPLR